MLENYVKETVYLGHRFTYPPENLIGTFIEAGKGWDNYLPAVLKALVPEESPTICEVGSNIGASLLRMTAAKPHARFLAFEPSDRFRPFLERNLRYAGAERVEVYPLLVGRTSAPQWLYVNTSSGSVTQQDYGEHAFVGAQFVYATTLDRLFEDEQVHFVKVDTDGYEFEVLRGGVATLKKWRPVLHFELTPKILDEPGDDMAWLGALGYRTFVCLAPEGDYIGTTNNVHTAIEWAWEDYCDVITAVEGSEREEGLLQLGARLPRPPT